MKNTTIIKLIGYLLLILYNYYIYDLIKKIKKNQTCLKENKCNINYEEKKVSILKYITIFMILFCILNIIIPCNKYLSKIPILGSIYSMIILFILTLENLLFNNILKRLNKSDCFKCLKINNIKLYKILLKTKFKTIFINVFISYLILIYL
jgi:hypothetical protein